MSLHAPSPAVDRLCAPDPGLLILGVRLLPGRGDDVLDVRVKRRR